MPAITPEFVESRRRGPYIVPAGDQWAGWTDRDAIRRHGIFVGDCSADAIVAELRSALAEYSAGGLLAGENCTGDDYDDAIAACRSLSIDAANGYFRDRQSA